MCFTYSPNTVPCMIIICSSYANSAYQTKLFHKYDIMEASVWGRPFTQEAPNNFWTLPSFGTDTQNWPLCLFFFFLRHTRKPIAPHSKGYTSLFGSWYSWACVKEAIVCGRGTWRRWKQVSVLASPAPSYRLPAATPPSLPPKLQRKHSTNQFGN